MTTSNVVHMTDKQNQAYRAIVEQRAALTDELPLSMFSNDVLVKAAHGLIDLNKIAAVELAQRGFSQDGRWVGFSKAHELAKTALTGAVAEL